MHARGSPHRSMRVAGLTSPCPSSLDAYSVQSERSCQGGTASDSRVSSVAAYIQEGMTTLMLVDLPYSLTLADLRDEMELLGFHHSYDFIFYPKERKQNFRGYCFVNFVTTAEAHRFARVFVDHKFELFPSAKLSNVQISRSQGLQENLSKIKPGATRFNNFYIDWSRVQNEHRPGGNAARDSGGWYGGYAAAEWNYPDYEAYEPQHSMFRGSCEVAPSQFPYHVAYQ
eukprot:TRINITY_DN2721_c0_g4_i1.p1 TRINITY_DN2721_c0_g4~~TRINITY_DN2721_c0_g4_i1.p1  ORF type:complete len:248 (-),score=35.49 TRINITY_DN2721_c0_g4_i1:254-937(-)